MFFLDIAVALLGRTFSTSKKETMLTNCTIRIDNLLTGGENGGARDGG